jgi:L-lysine 2,3-aminomutase
VKLQAEANIIRAKLNPHPAGQKTLNVPKVNGQDLPGLQHKYRETALHFATEAQYCHAYCTYCFRWAQFVSVGSPLQFANKDADLLAAYLGQSKMISDLLLTGGDPMVMTAEQMGRYVRPLLNSKEHEHIQTIRIGTKSLAYWPYRFVTDADADPMLRLLEETVKSGKHVSIMAHFTHPAELSTPVVREAIRRIRNTGAQIRTQAPLVGHVNDDAAAWSRMWREQVRLGCVPYYFFVSRDTGPREYFNVPLVKAYDIFNTAFQQQSGLAKTVRGPSMSCDPGKVHYLGPAEVAGEKVMMFKFLQGRNPAWADKPFFAKYDDKAVWLDDLVPAFGQDKFFFEDEFQQIVQAGASSGQLYQDRVA